VILCGAFLAGVGMASFFVYPKSDFEFWILEGVAILFCALGLIAGVKKKGKIFFLALGFLIFGLVVYGYKEQEFVGGLANLYGKNLAFTGQTVREPDVRGTKTKLVVGNLKIENRRVDGLILLEVRRFPEYKFGQVVKFMGRVEEPPVFDDFSYKDYLKKEGITAQVRFPKSTEVVGEATDFWTKVQSWLFELKTKFVQTLCKMIPEPFAAFLGGILLGAKRSIDERLQLAFALTGTAHIVAISGYNISVITSILGKWVRKLFSPKSTFIILAILVSAFVVLTGAPSSVLREGIMGLLALLAMFFSRPSAAFRLLILACAVMVVINPLILRYDVGFQLSATAAAGLILLSPRIRKKKAIEKMGLFGGALADTLAAMIFTLPLLLFYFNKLTILAPLVNMIILPFLPFAMGLGFLTVVSAFAFSWLGEIIGIFTTYLLAFLVKTIEFFASTPASAIKMQFSPIYIIIYYLILTSFCLKYSQRK